MEFNTQRIATPVSANTASHMEAIPMSPSTMTSAFTASANTTFWLEIAPVLFAILIAVGIASMLEVINTTSAASIAASAPLPIAAPTSAPARTGASLIPSPTNIALPLSARSFCRISSFSAGRSFA